LLDAGGRGREAIALWEEVPPSHPRWRESRTAIVAAHSEAVRSLLDEGKPAEAGDRLAEARAALDSIRGESDDPDARNAFDLARADLELLPGLRSPEIAEALDLLDHLVATESDAPRRDAARRLRILALVLDQQLADAEREAREELERSEPEAIVPLAERLDRAAASAPEPSRRRIAGIARLLTERVLARADDLEPGLRARARVVRIRGQLETGDLDGARASAQSWAGDLLPDRLPAALLPPLADALDRLGLYAQAADVQRAIIAAHPPGSLPWFEARYGLAVSYYRTGRPADARRLIDGTSALHPELGGPELREQFTRLRRRLESP
jgi:tetratricopeptide (TPR) repeat protein